MNKPEEYGGIGNALLGYWITKESLNSENKNKQVQDYKNNLAHFNTDMLDMGAKISRITICLPIDYFKSSIAFFNWTMQLNLIKKGRFNFATAGYRLNYFEGIKIIKQGKYC